ncbi:MAG: DUF3494 domain-containing protein [Opitutae bacterium]|nr:DUF3494 domain-containing protein [Opitutae bacterium]
MKNYLSITPLRLAALVALLCAPLAALAQTILRTAADFTLLGGTAISNAGTTAISNGNAGLSPAAESSITGFGSVTFTNGAIIATGPATAQARTDLIAARTGLAGMTPTANLTGSDLGGLTLTPGVYKFDAAAAQTGTLTLDANFQNSVAWVFQIGTTLTTVANSSVIVINLGSNQGSDLGLFWNAAAGAINIGTNNTVAGNYLAGTSITFTSLATGSGRALALAAVTLDTDSLNARGGPGPAGSDWTGGLAFAGDGTTIVLAAVPEPAAVLWLTPLGAFGFVLWRRTARRRAALAA